MDKKLQNTDEMRDEELYALLDKAYETERLCVSEDLIQRTLARVAEEGDTKAVSFETAKKRKIPAVKYIGVAAAAVLVVFVGVRTLGNGGVAKDAAPMEAECDNAGYKNEALLADSAGGRGGSVTEGSRKGTEYYYSVSDSDAVTQHETADDMMADAVVPKEDITGMQFPGSEVLEENEGALTGTEVTISAELAEALTAVGAEPVSGKAEYWELVQREKTWEQELFYELAACMDVFGERLPEGGSYRYGLGRNDGSSLSVYSDEPLDGIVRVETKKGTLWGLFGNTTRFYTE